MATPQGAKTSLRLVHLPYGEHTKVSIPRIGAAVALAVVTVSVLLATVCAGRNTPVAMTVGDSRPLSPRGLANVTALTKLLGYVRYFYPSDAVSLQDWNTVAVHGVRAVEDAKNSTALLSELRKMFVPIAPALVVFPTGTKPPSGPSPQHLDETPYVAWRHFGFADQGFPAPPDGERPYHSELAQVDSPQAPLLVDLGAGVSCSLPLALPRSGVTAAALPPSPLPEYVFPATDRASRLAGIMVAWNVLQHFYPYFDVVQTDWQAALRTGLSEAALDVDQPALLTTMRRMVALLHDGHGYVSAWPQSAPTCLPLTWDWFDEDLVVTSTRTPSVAQGDVVVRIDGVPVTQLFTRAEQLQPGATPQWVRFRALEELTQVRGPRAALEVRRHLTGELQRVEIESQSRCYQLMSRTRPKVEEVEAGVFYLDMDRVTNEDFSAALPQLARATGIVFDFRGYRR